MTFEELGLEAGILEALYYMNFEKATAIQEQAIPLIMEGKDLLACAQTGTGKTGAFLLPILHKLVTTKANKTEVLIVVPTRELALQIDQELEGFSYYTNMSSISIYGGGSGKDWEIQKRALKKGTQIIVATPGKLLTYINMKYIDLESIKYLILDEADRMLDIGFQDDIVNIVKALVNREQTLMFSATMPSKIKKLANTILKDPEEIIIALSKPAAGVLQAAYLVKERQKIDLLVHLIKDKPNYKSILVFSSTKKKISEITQALKRKKENADQISSNLDQSDREKVLLSFRAKRTRILVATDVISRGIDIKDINLVINFDVPGDAEDYVHRIGRTARADTTGVAITFVNKDDMFNFDRIEKLIEKEVQKIKLPEFLGEGPKWSLSRDKSNYRNKKSHGRSGNKKGKGGNHRGKGGNHRGKGNQNRR